jgi:Ca2+-binding RTX toxin-like protein
VADPRFRAGLGGQVEFSPDGETVRANAGGAIQVLTATDGRKLDEFTFGDEKMFTNVRFSGDGSDEIDGEDGRDSLDGAAGNDEIFGGLDPDTIFGGIGDDSIAGRLGNDEIDGGDGTDRVEIETNGNVTLRDTLTTGQGTDTLASIEQASVVEFFFGCRIHRTF